MYICSSKYVINILSGTIEVSSNEHLIYFLRKCFVFVQAIEFFVSYTSHRVFLYALYIVMRHSFSTTLNELGIKALKAFHFSTNTTS